MNILRSTGDDSLAKVYIAEFGSGKVVEFVESLQPPIPREKKWVLIVSTLFGCPVSCPICDAGGFYKGKLSKDEILAQIDYIVGRRFPDGFISIEKFKIQFARMGDPAFNTNVLDVLEELPDKYNAPGLMPCISTVAPSGTSRFFDRLLEIKQKLYSGKFQMQFSIHSTNPEERDKLIPVKKWSFSDIAEYGKRFFRAGDRKIALNFALAESSVIEPDVLQRFFDPNLFMIKITPVNPTYNSVKNGIKSNIFADHNNNELVDSLKCAGYDTLISIGELKENEIGSNCGQYVMRYLQNPVPLANAYIFNLPSSPEELTAVSSKEAE